MTRLFNAPEDFADEMVAGFVAANRRYVRAVPGGVARATVSTPGTVAVVIGGGSGHYPAFGGLVGQGLAHGAAMGNLFASPSAQQVHDVAVAADNGGGVLLTYGNYAGDVLNFDAAQERLRSEGIPCETVVVTDDVSSAPPDQRSKRRGIAGDLTVFKTAAAASEAGYPLNEVVRVARHANNRTRSLGVAFSGCTLPGATEPLFEVPEGRMAVGMGIHGEPGIEETAVPTADGVARLLVAGLLREVPDDIRSIAGARVIPILNGLGSVKYEELFVVFKSVDQELEAAGVEVVDPQVGEFCTSFDMAGASLTLLWIDDELERLWTAPTDTPAFRRGSVDRADQIVPGTAEIESAQEVEEGASDESRAFAVYGVSLFERIADVIDEHVDELGRIDAVAGDGDHGIGMRRGAHAARKAAEQAARSGAGLGTVFRHAGAAWAHRAGGTSGALWGAALDAVGQQLGDERKPDRDRVVAAVADGVTAITSYGKARPGDKTMVDALVPFRQTLHDAVSRGSGLHAAWMDAADTATAAASATAELLPRMGRARPHAEKSLGTPDAGAVSFALIVTAITGLLDPEHATLQKENES